MRIGVLIGGSASRLQVEDFVARARELESRGFATLWIPHVFGLDAVTVAAIVGRETRRIEIGTSVVPTYPRHPVALAQQALTAADASAGRFTLGIGLSHPVVIENMLGLSYARRARHMREYLAVLGPLLRGERADFEGDEYRVHFALELEQPRPVPVLIAALGEKMLELAGRSAAGTLLWMAGPRTIERHIVPRIAAAAREAGRAAPRIVAGVHIVLTGKPAQARERVARMLEMYGQMPSYRALLAMEGSDATDTIALAGDERHLDAGLARLRDLGVTDFEASILPAEDGAEARTLDYLASRTRTWED